MLEADAMMTSSIDQWTITTTTYYYYYYHYYYYDY